MVQPWALARSIGVCALAALLFAAVLLATRGLNLAVDFTGGIVIDTRVPTAHAVIEDALAEAGVGDVVLKNASGRPSDEFIIVPRRKDVLASQATSSAGARFADSLKQRHVEVDQVETITANVGSELLRVGAVLPVLAFVVAAIYLVVRYGRRHALPAIVVTLGAMAIAAGLVLCAYSLSQWEFSLASLLEVDGLAILALVIAAAQGGQLAR